MSETHAVVPITPRSIVRGRLDKVRGREGVKGMALCRAHEDRTPSLSWKVKPNGDVLLHCFAGCDITDICSAVGLRVSELYANTDGFYRPPPPGSLSTIKTPVRPEVSIPPPYTPNSVAGTTQISPLPLASLLENVPPEPDWLLRGYVAPYAVTLVAGRPKVGKSTLLFALLARLIAGTPFAGVETASAGALVLTEERRDTLAEKARMLGLVSIPPPSIPIDGANEKRPVDVQLRHDTGSVAWPEIVKQSIAYCSRRELRVLVVDTWDRWTSLRGDSENAAGAVNEALEPLLYAAASGLAVVIVTHQRKSFGEFGEAVRGSNALTGGVDIVLELERPAPSLGLTKHARVLRAVSRFTSTPDELYVELDEENSQFAAIDSPEDLKSAKDQERILSVLGEHDEAKSIAQEVELKESTVRRHLSAMLERGLVQREGKGHRGDPFRWTVCEEEQA